MNRTDLPALTLFASVAAHRSFRGAARELGLSVSAISHAVTGLEARLGVRLLARTTRSVAPTEAGLRLLEGLEPALAAIASAVEAASAVEGRISGVLRLTVPMLAADHYLSPVALRFVAAFPGVTLDIEAQDGFVDIVSGGFDAGVRLGESLQQDMIAVPLSPPLRGVVVGAPAYFATHAPPAHPRDLVAHRCIGRRFHSGRVYRWEFSKDGEEMEIAVDGPLIYNDDRLTEEAALAGAGLSFQLEPRVSSHLAQGRLIQVLEDWCPSFPGFFLYYPSRRQMRPVLRAFLDFLRAARTAPPSGLA